MRRFPIISLSLLFIFLFSCSTENAKFVIENLSEAKCDVDLSLSLDKVDGCDQFSYRYENNKLYIEGSSNVALCRAFYDFAKSNGFGLYSWSGSRFDFPENITGDDIKIKSKHVVSPFKHHYYLNVVTYGYSMPYWNWERWSQEIDWMALHGIDMAMALVSNEAITERVFKKIGLTDEEISNYFVGPAHLPWLRMGNISKLDSPLPEQWHHGQIELMHKILDKMRSLGMTPICPGFAGFVPKEIKRIYPNLELIETSWGGGNFHNWMINPKDDLFAEIGQMFIEEWEKEYGKCDYYLIDSFNEMDIPFPEKGNPERYSLLAEYGEKVYNSMVSGNKNATWVMMGWMFGFQRDIWDYETLSALLSKVPDDRMLLLDLAVDYSKLFWKTGYNWDFYKGFNNKKWVYSVIPNMGGKVGMTGDLEFYANRGRLDVLNSPNKGHLEAFGFAPEGIENNEVIYELLSDAGWESDSIDLDKWLENYSICRYGAAPKEIMNFWDELRQGVYGSFTDHPSYAWQFSPGFSSKGSIKIDDHLFKGIKSFASVADSLSLSPLYTIDLQEMTAHYLGARMEETLYKINQKHERNEDFSSEKELFFDMGMALDQALFTHPTLTLKRWINFAREWGDTRESADYYESNAKRIVTVWGPPIQDYSARIWSGLVRDYYLPRWEKFFESSLSGKDADLSSWEENWVKHSNSVSSTTRFTKPRTTCKELIEKY